MVMKTKISLLSVIYIFVSLGTFAQTSPGGIGNSDGSGGQPELYLWLLPDSLGLADNDDVLSWNDYSGKNQNLSAASKTSPVFRANKLNSHDYIEFSKSKNRIVGNPFNMPSDAVSVFTVLRTTDKGDALLSYAVPGSSNEYLLYQSNNPSTYIQGSSSNMGSAFNDGSWTILSHQWRNPDGQLLMNLDGTQAGSGTLKSGASIVNGGAFAIGGEQDAVDGGYQANQAFQGDIAELIVYGSPLRKAERTVVENYLAQKYGLDANLPSDMYVPLDVSYTVDMTGMGKESDGTNKLNSGGLVVTQNGNFVNGDYVFAAHDGTVNAVNTTPGVLYPGIEVAWQRDWYVDKTGTVDVKMAFDFGEGIGGNYPANIENYRLLYKANLVDNYDTISVAGRGVQNGDQLYFSVNDAQFSDGYYTLGTIDQTNSPVEGVTNRTWYTLISGDWDNWEVWTLDPSGALPNNPNHLTPSTSPTSNADKVVVLTGKTVTVSNNNKIHNSLKVDGRLDLQSTSGHSFGEINGGGRILLSGDHFPSGDASNFISRGQGEGTVEYYGSGFDLTTSREFFNLEINMGASSGQLNLLSDYTINGELRITSGTLQVNDNVSTTNLNITVNGDVVVESNGAILTGTANARHQFNFYGDFTNNGTVEFTNRTAPGYGSEATNGIVDANFLNDSENQKALLNGSSTFYRIEIDKGTDDTYEMALEATAPSYFNIYGYAAEGHNSTPRLAQNNNALGLIKGTVRIKSNVSIPVLNTVGNYNINESARLWVDGGSVYKNGGTAIVPYGKVLVSGGILEARINSGITLRQNGLVKVEGGTVNINQLRTSTLGSNNIGGYVQSGGTTNILGGSTNTDYYCFNLTYPGNVFNMSGGMLHIHEANGKGGIFIASSETNYNVTGGTVIMEIDNGIDFPITSTAPFWNVIVRNSSNGPGKHLLTGGTNVGATDENLAVQDLHVLNDLTIETGTTRSETAGGVSNTYGGYLDLVPDNANPADLYIGRNLTIEDNAVLDVWGWTGTDNSTSATLYFKGSSDAVFNIGDITSYSNALLEYASPDVSDGGPDGNFPSQGTGEMHTWKYNLPLYNLVVDKPAGKLSLAANNPGKGSNWGNAAGQAGNWVLSNGGKNTRRWLSQLLSIKNQFKLLNGTFSQIDPYNMVTIVESGGGTYGSVGDPVGYSVNLFTTDVEIRDTMFVYNAGSTPKEGIIEVRAPNPLNLQTTDNAFIGNMRFIDDHNNPVTLVSDVHFGRIEYFNGTIDIGTHNMKVDLFETYAVKNTIRMDAVSSGQPVFDVPNFIRMAGNVSDGGLSLKVPKQPTWPLPNNDEFEYLSNSWDEEQGPYAFPDRLWFPIGTGASGTDKFTPAVCRLQNYGTTDGDEYITVKVVDKELQTTDLAGGDILSYYWNVDFEGYAAGEEPTVSWIFQYDDADLDVGAGDETAFVPGKVLDGGTYTRSDEGGTAAVKNGGASTIEGNILGNNPTNIIIFNGTGTSAAIDPNDNIESINSRMFNTVATGSNINANWQNAWPNTGFTLENANYTAGEANRFVGAPTIYYSVRNSGWGGFNWDNNTSWYDAPTGTNNPPDYPTAGDIAVIRGNNGQDAINVNGNQEAAEVIMQREGTYADIEDLPRLRFAPTDQLTAGKISGVGDLYLQQDIGNGPVLNTDIGEFAANDTSLVEFYLSSNNGTYNVALVDFFDVLPTLRVYGNNGNYNRVVSFNYDMSVKNLIVDGEAVMKMGGNYTVENRTRLGYTGGGRIEYPNGIDSYTFKTGEFVTGRGKNQDDNTFRVTVDEGGGNGIEHTFEVERDINLNFPGTVGGEGSIIFDLFSTINDNNVILKLSGTGDHSFIDNYSPGNSTIDLYKIEMDKGTDTASTFTFEDNFTLNGPTSGVGIPKAIKLQNGKLILNDPNINVDLTTGDDNFYIPGSAGLEVRQGQASANGNSGILLDGKLQISGGTVDMSGGDNYIQYSASGSAAIDVSSGNLIVGSQIRRGLTSSEGILNYSQSGGTVVVGNNAAPENDRGVLEVLNTNSNFSLTGGDLYIARAQDNPGVAALYLKPATSSVAAAANIFIGHANTPANQTVGIYSNVDLSNLTIDNSSANGPAVQIQTVPLTVNNHLDIQSGASFDANGEKLTLNGDITANGAFIANGNTTFFSSNSAQQIVGSPAFYNVTKDGSGTLALNNDVTINNVFNHQSGVLSDNSNTLSVKGNLVFEGDQNWGGAGNGILMNGSQQQTLQGSGAFGKLTINNPAGVFVPQGNTININGALQLDNGVFDIGKNLLELTSNASIIEGNAFSEQNMIQTNISFTDAGVKKWFPAISSPTTFIYPIGSAGKYTPVEFNIDQLDAGSYMRIKAADERHPTVVNDDEPCNDITDTLNALNYHWVLETSGVNNFTGTASMKYYPADVLIDNSLSGTTYDITDYVTARLLSNRTDWNKYDANSFDETNELLMFYFSNTDDNGVSGDYTAGIEDQSGSCEGAIPDVVPTYITTTNGIWGDGSIWDTYPASGGTVPAGGPRGASVIVAHDVSITNNYKVSYKTEIQKTGNLSVGSTYGHRLGEVTGKGTLSLLRGDLPAGVFDNFLSASGGTLEYGGNGNYDVLSENTFVNNLRFVGTGERRLPNLSIQAYGDIELNGPTLINEHNRTLSLKGDFIYDSGVFDAGTGADAKLVLNGNATQNIGGLADFTRGNNSSLNHLEVNNSTGVVVDSDVEIETSLSLTDGVVNNNLGNRFAVLSYDAGSVSGGSPLSYVNGPFEKSVNTGGSFAFPVGDKGRYGEITLLETGTVSAAVWETRYFNHNPGNDGFDPNSMGTSLAYVSNNEYWRIKAPETTDAHVTIRWDDQSGVSADATERQDLRLVSWNDLATDAWEEAGSNITDNGQNSGTIKSDVLQNFNEFTAVGNYFTLGGTLVYTYPWIGTSPDWFDSNNWNSGNVPSINTEVSIPSNPTGGNYPVVNGDAYAKDLIINSTTTDSATVTVSPGSSLEISNDLTNDGYLILESTNSALSSLMLPQTTTKKGLVNVKMTLDPNHYWYMSSPVKNAVAGWFKPTEVPADDYVYVFEVVNNRWQWVRLNQTDVNTNKTIAPMQGVVGYYYNNPKKLNYTGKVYNGSVTITPDDPGYHLVGNPFPAAIDWEDPAGWIRKGFSNTMWSWINSGGKRVISTYNNNGDALPGVCTMNPPAGYDASTMSHIPPYQSVWLKQDTSAAVPLTVKRAARVKKSNAPLKSSSSQDASKVYDLLRVQAENSHTRDGAVLYFHEKFTEGKGREDSEKRFNGSEDIPELYTRINEEAMSINGMPSLKADAYQIPLSVRNRVEEEVTLHFNAENFRDDYDIYLEDKEKGSWLNVRKLDSYAYQPSQIGEDHERFVIHLEKVQSVATDVKEALQNENIGGIAISGCRDYALVSIDENLLQPSEATVELLDINGRLILSRKTNSAETEVGLPDESGVYVVRVHVGGKVKTEKVVRSTGD